MSHSSPVRTCVGCRERAAKSDLVRVVAEDHAPHPAVVLDEGGSMAGRGAHVHPTVGCLDRAERRRAFPRALRHEGPLDTSALRSWINEHGRSSPEVPASATQRKRSNGS